MRKLANEELDRKSREEFRAARKMPVVLVLDNVRSMHNVGSVFRTADAFLVEALYLCGLTATPPHREIQKTALGATETVTWEHFTDTVTAIEKLRQDGYKIYALEQAEKSISLEKFAPGKEEKLALIFGNEVEGVQQNVIDLCDGCIEIPQFGTKHSFNISVSAGIVLWDLFTKKFHV
ncbi:MAG: tRNA/rRNA methyltransferase (spou) [Bacteroidetes bacterium]|nr:MAG: tRNA/rRNA methyltransferase (spou) [Bacteroidota bacterium]